MKTTRRKNEKKIQEKQNREGDKTNYKKIGKKRKKKIRQKIKKNNETTKKKWINETFRLVVEIDALCQPTSVAKCQNCYFEFRF